MCDMCGRAGKVKGTRICAEVAFRRVLSKRFYEKFPRIHNKTFVLESNFDKVKLCRLYNFINIEFFREGVFLLNLRNLLEHIFRRAPPADCF